MGKQAKTQMDRQTEKETDGQADRRRQLNRQTDKETAEQADRQGDS